MIKTKIKETAMEDNMLTYFKYRASEMDFIIFKKKYYSQPHGGI